MRRFRTILAVSLCMACLHPGLLASAEEPPRLTFTQLVDSIKAELEVTQKVAHEAKAAEAATNNNLRDFGFLPERTKCLMRKSDYKHCPRIAKPYLLSFAVSSTVSRGIAGTNLLFSFLRRLI